MNADKGCMDFVAIGSIVVKRHIRVYLRLSAVALFLGAGAPAAAQDADDAFRFLENRSDPRAEEFFKRQAAFAAERLSTLPGRPEMLARIRALAEAGTSVTRLKLTTRHVFYLRQSGAQANPVLCMREGGGGVERVLLDPARFDAAGGKAAIDWYEPAPDGRHVAYGVSLGGSEASVLHVLATDGPRDLAVEIDRARFNEELAWHPDGRSFFYARIPAGTTGARANANVRLYRHVLGRDAARDEIVFAPGVGGARDVPEYVYPSLHIPAESRHAYAIAREGVRREIAVHVTELRDLAQGKPQWRKVAGVSDEVLAIEGWKGDLYLLSKKGAPRHRVLRVAAGATSLAGAQVVLPEADVVVRSMGLARDALYLRTMEGGNDRLERVPIGLLGRIKKAEFVRIPFDVSITELVTHPETPGVLLLLQGWIDPPRVMQLDAKSGELRDTRVQPPSSIDFSAMDEVRLYAPAHDGAKIPVTLVYAKATRLTGQNPTVITAYGAHGVTQSPVFDAARLAWLERGGVYAIAHVRGGGEYGAAWHEAGRGPAKSNTIQDLVSVAEYLVRYGFTNPAKLAIMGRGAGGIAVGGALVRRPDLFAAVVARAPLMDMVRFEQSAEGPSQVPEFGSAATPQGASALRAISAYHQVRNLAAYPAVLLTTGWNDARVEPWQPGKMAARLQAANPHGKPALLRIDFEGGHGPATARARRLEELADIYSFLLWQLGDPQFQPSIVEVPPAAANVPDPFSPR